VQLDIQVRGITGTAVAARSQKVIAEA